MFRNDRVGVKSYPHPRGIMQTCMEFMKPFSTARSRAVSRLHLTTGHVTAGLELIKAISTREEAVRNAQMIHSIYGEGYAFPHWSLEWLAKATDAQLDRAVLLHHETDSRDECITLATEREPVNIAMNRLYSSSRLKEAFGYEKGGYSRSTSARLDGWRIESSRCTESTNEVGGTPREIAVCRSSR